MAAPVFGKLGAAGAQVWPKRDLCRADPTETGSGTDFRAEIVPEFVRIPLGQ